MLAGSRRGKRKGLLRPSSLAQARREKDQARLPADGDQGHPTCAHQHFLWGGFCIFRPPLLKRCRAASLVSPPPSPEPPDTSRACQSRKPQDVAAHAWQGLALGLWAEFPWPSSSTLTPWGVRAQNTLSSCLWSPLLPSCHWKSCLPGLPGRSPAPSLPTSQEGSRRAEASPGGGEGWAGHEAHAHNSQRCRLRS